MAEDFLLGDVRIRPDRLSIERAGTTIAIEPKVMEALLCLTSRAGQTVSRQDLMNAAWPDVHVSEDALNRCIWKLRRALGDDRDAPRFIATVPKRGYRLLATVRPVSSSATPPRAHPMTTQPLWRRAATPVVLSVVVGALMASSRLSPATGAAVPELDRADRIIEPFTSLDGYETAPAISPDGTTVAFQHYRLDGAGRGQFDLLLQRVDAVGAPTVVVDTPADEVLPAWSPDGLRLAYRRQSDDACQVVVRTLSTGAERTVTACDRSLWSSIAWTPTGDGLLTAERDDPAGPSHIVRIALEDGQRSLLTDPPGGRGDVDPIVSPDGRHIAFARMRTADLGDVYVVSTSGAGEQQVTRDGARRAGFAWSSDGRHLIYASNRLGPFRLWTIPARGGEPQLVQTVGVNATTPAVGRHGPALVYEEWNSRIDIRQVELVPPGAVGRPAWSAARLVTSTRWDTEAQWSPDGSQIAFLSDRLGATDIWLADGDGGNARRISDLGARFAARLAWAPDGTRVAFTMPVGGQLDVHIADVRNGRVTRLTNDPSDDREPAWSADGQRIYFSSHRSGQWEVWRQPVAGGRADVVTTDGGMAPASAADGVVYFVKAMVPGLWRLDAEGRETRVLDQPPAGQTAWAVSDAAAYIVETGSRGRTVLVRYDLDSGQGVEVAQLEADHDYPEWFGGAGIALAPDGRRVAFSSIEHSASDLWIVRGR